MMTHGEAWLLETLAMFRLPVWCLTRKEQVMRDWLNRGYHGLTEAELVRTMHRLFERRDIEAFSDDDGNGYRPSERQLLAALQEVDKDMYCGVSEQGGARWETLANPDWRRYFEDCGWDGTFVEISAGSRDRLFEIVDNSEILWRAKMNLNALDVQEISPWKPVHWKQLRKGFRAIVKYETMSFIFVSPEEVESEHRRTWQRDVELRTWATSICGHAYV